ncbi:hypothetical protein Tco_0889600, partial [Tanacetum coccineum]
MDPSTSRPAVVIDNGTGYLGSRESFEGDMDGTEEFLSSNLFDFLLTKVNTDRLKVSTDSGLFGKDGWEYRVSSNYGLSHMQFNYYALIGKNFSGKVTRLFDFMLVQQTEDEDEASERPSDSQPLPHLIVLDFNLKGSGNHGGQSSNDISLSGNEDGLTLQSVKKLKKGVKPLITHHKSWMKSVALKIRLARKTYLKKKGVQMGYVSKEGRKSIKSFKGEPSVHKDPTFDDLDEIVDDTMDYVESKDAKDEERTSSMVVEEKESADKEVSTKAPVSIVKPNK